MAQEWIPNEHELRDIKHRYLDLNESQAKLAKRYNIKTTSMSWILKKNNIKKGDGWSNSKYSDQTKQEVCRLYSEEKMKMAEISRFLDMPYQSIQYILGTLGLIAINHKTKQKSIRKARKIIVNCHCLRCDMKYQVKVSSDDWGGGDKTWYRDHHKFGEECPRKRPIQIPTMHF